MAGANINNIYVSNIVFQKTKPGWYNKWQRLEIKREKKWRSHLFQLQLILKTIIWWVLKQSQVELEHHIIRQKKFTYK